MKTTTKNHKRNRIAVHRSNKHIYVQIIDDAKGKTLVSASDHEIEKSKKAVNKTQKAEQVGELLAGKAKKKKIGKAYFDRRHYRYHGRIKALAEGARKGGLQF